MAKAHKPPSIYGKVVDMEIQREDRWREFLLKPLEFRPDIPGARNWMKYVERVYSSATYIVQQTFVMEATYFGNRHFFALSFRRLNERDIMEPWSNLNTMVRELIGPEGWAMEFFPPDEFSIDLAPMRWIWVFPDDDEIVPIGLHRKGMAGPVFERAVAHVIPGATDGP